MAISNDNTRFADLKARLAALNCELLEDESDDESRYYVLDKAKGRLVSVCSTLNDTYDWLESEERDRSMDPYTRILEPGLALRFRSLELDYAAKPLSAVMAKLRANGYVVTKIKAQGGDDDLSDEYAITKTWTEKGVRSYAALATLCDPLWVAAAELESRGE